MGSFLNRWDDPGLEVDMGWDPEAFSRTQVERLLPLVGLANFAAGMKHRLGPDATREELAIDKKRCKKYKAAFRQFAMQWGATEEDIDAYCAENSEELSQTGAQVDWEKFISDHKTDIQTLLRLVATTCIRTGHLKVGNSFCNRLLNEVNVAGNTFERTSQPRQKSAKNGE